MLSTTHTNSCISSLHTQRDVLVHTTWKQLC